MVHGLGERLRKVRIDKNLSQKEVAAVLGISAAVISNYESGGRSPSVENLLALARLYQCSTDYLLGFEKYVPQRTIDISSLNDLQANSLKNFIKTL